MKVLKPPKPTGSMVGGLPTYSPEQFQQVRPGGSYKSYLNFINRRRGVTKGPKWPGRGGPGLPTYESLIRGVQLQTPQQIEAQAGRMTAAQVAAQKGLASDAARAAMADALRSQKALSQAGLAAANMNRGLFGAVGGEYNAAARELANLGTGSVAAAQQGTERNVAATNEALARVGAPPVEATGLMAGPAQAGMELFRGAGLPGQDLVRQGQAAEFGLAGLTNAQNLRATQEANAALAQSTQQIAQTRQAAMQEIARGRPQVAAQFLEQLKTAQNQQVALAMSLIEARRGALQTGFEQSQTKIATAAAKAQQQVENEQWTKSFNAAQTAAARTGKQVDENRSVAFGYYVDMNGNPILKNGKRIPVPKTTAAAKTTEPLRQRMGQSANYWVKDRVNTRTGAVSGSKEQLYNYLLATYPGNPGIAKQIADSTYPAGGGGKKFKALK